MIDERRRHLHIIVLHDETAGAELVRMNERRQRFAALIGDAGVDVEGVEIEEQLRHLRQRRRPPGVDTRLQSRGPRQQQQVAIVSVVIRVLVRYEDVTQAGGRHTGRHQLTRNAVSAVHDVRRAIDDDHLSRR